MPYDMQNSGFEYTGPLTDADYIFVAPGGVAASRPLNAKPTLVWAYTLAKMTANAAAVYAALGAVPAANLPAPGVSALGGVKSASAPTHQFMTGIDTSGNPVFAQPAAADISGLSLTWGAIIGTPTTLAGYGISDAYTIAQTDTLLAAKAPLANPTLTGVVTVPNQTAGNNSTRAANTAYVDSAIAALINSAPGTLDTLAEIAAAIAADESTAAALATTVAGKLTASNNLSDVANAGAARTNLGLGTAATQNTSAFLLPSNNLSDLGSAATARSNLGLGSLATASSVAWGSITSTPTTFTGYGFTGAQTLALGTVNGTGLSITQDATGTGTYTFLKFDLTGDTGPSNAASLLLDLQYGSTSKWKADKSGNVTQQGYLLFADGTKVVNSSPTSSANQVGIWAGGLIGLNRGGGSQSQFVAYADGLFGASLNGGTSGGTQPSLTFANPASGTQDIFLMRAAAATLQHGAADAASPVAQTIRFQSVVAGTSNTAGANATIQGSAGTGTGVGGDIVLAVALPGSSGTTQNSWSNVWKVAGATGHLLAVTDNVYDIGANGANRPKSLYLGGGAYIGGNVTVAAGSNFVTQGRSFLSSPADGIFTLFNNAGSAFDRLQFGGTSSSYPALKRSSATLQARLADDSAFAVIQGKITTDAVYVATPPTCTGYITLYDSTGTPYKVMVST